MRDESVKLNLTPDGPRTERPISIAIVAMGGQGGGVLSDWVVSLAEAQGWVAQATSVPGVAQRTGATIYYVEMMRPGPDGRRPILAQMPTPGDVDVVLAAEYMEAGRSILRGLVTPDRTTLIASSHRTLSTIEKIAPGEGIADSHAVTQAIGVVARQTICFDMNALAVANGSVISAAMFGCLAASDALDFDAAAYHAVIRQSGKGVSASLRTFDAAFARARSGTPPEEKGAADPAKLAARPVPVPSKAADALLQSLRAGLPEEAHAMALAGLQKVVDFQDARYGEEYLGLLKDLHACDQRLGGAARGWAFTVEAAKYLANAMAYDDVISVADLKTRSARFSRVLGEIGANPDQVVNTTEYMHPRMEEVSSIMPAGMARWLRNRKRLYAWLDRRVDRGRRVRTYSLPGFLMLYGLGGLKVIRRRSLRHQEETRHRDAWLAAARAALEQNYDLAVEILRFRRLIKGYSDTHSRGQSKFDKVMAATQRIARRADAADWARRLSASAIRDADSADLDGTIRTIESFA